MKVYQITIILIFLTVFTACSEGENKHETQKQSTTTEIVASDIQIEVPIEGMSCMMCVNKIEKGLKAERGIKSVSVNLEKNNAILFFNPEETEATEISNKIIHLGYKPGEVNVL